MRKHKIYPIADIHMRSHTRRRARLREDGDAALYCWAFLISPLLPTALLAKQIGTLDDLSNSRLSIGRVGRTKNISPVALRGRGAKSMLFLASESAAFIAGEDIRVTGGLM